VRSFVRQFLVLFAFFLTGCSTTIPSGSLLLHEVKKVYSRDEFVSLDMGRRYACFLRLGGKDTDIVDGSFVATSGFKGPHNKSHAIAFVTPGMKAEVGDIIEIEAYAIKEKNIITRIRQKNAQNGPCRYVTNRFLWNTAEDLYCDGIEREGWGKISGSYGTFYKQPKGSVIREKRSTGENSR